MPTANTGFASGGVTCKLGALCFYSSSVLADSFVLRNPPERKARKRCQQLGTNAMTTEISVHCVSSLANHRSFQSLSCFAELLTTARTQNKKLPTLT